MPAGSPVQVAATAESVPATEPSWPIGAASFASTNPANPGFSAAQKSADGYSPSCRMPLYPAEQALRTYEPVSCQTIQSAASTNESIAA